MNGLKIIHWSLIFLVLMTAQVLQAKDDYDFRQVRWSMTMEEVKKAEPQLILKNEDPRGLLTYELSMYGEKFDLNYDFDQETKLLGQITLYNPKPIEDPDRAATLNKQLKNFFIEQYGQPYQDEIQNYLDNSQAIDEASLGRFVLNGDAVVLAFWDAEKTDMAYMMLGGDSGINIVAALIRQTKPPEQRRQSLNPGPN